MQNSLKNLYTYLIANDIHNHQVWHNEYQAFVAEVDERRRQLPTKPLSASEDEPFLKKLLFERANGVTTRGQSILSKDDFALFTADPKFLSALTDLMLTPSGDTYLAFKKAWRDQGKTKNPLLINRVAAACTLDVSTTVDESRFEMVFKWLIAEKLIEPYAKGGPQDWYHQNIYLVKALRTAFHDELASEATDHYFLNQFVWEMFLNIANPFSLKKQVVKYGPPGTGKTYTAKQQTKLVFDIWQDKFDTEPRYRYESQMKLVQFHPSYSYEDFMEGLRPVPHNGAVQLTLHNGVFKQFCRKAARWELDFMAHAIQAAQAVEWENATVAQLGSWPGLNEALWGKIKTLDPITRLADAVPPFF